jgi:hypothetical protein
LTKDGSGYILGDVWTPLVYFSQKHLVTLKWGCIVRGATVIEFSFASRGQGVYPRISDDEL